MMIFLILWAIIGGTIGTLVASAPDTNATLDPKSMEILKSYVGLTMLVAWPIYLIAVLHILAVKEKP